jgi:parallel beta-helix repeat protein
MMKLAALLVVLFCRACVAAEATDAYVGNVGNVGNAIASTQGRHVMSATSRSTGDYCAKEYKHKRKRYVSNSSELRNALRSAKPGDLIMVKDGRYTGGFEIRNKKGSVWRPITVCGSKNAVFDSRNNVGFLLHKTKYVNLVGVTVKGADKGIRLETAEKCTLDKVSVMNTGAEGIHIQYRSHYNTVKNSRISNCGKRVKRVGEGIYLGSSSRNVRRDVCIGNKILNNKITGTRAEPIDVKEYSRDGVISGNFLDGSRLCKCPDATSLINIKGNGYRIENNVGRNAIEDFFKTSQVSRAGGQGRNNIFKNNKCLTKVRRGSSCTRRPGGGNRGNKFY